MNEMDIAQKVSPVQFIIDNHIRNENGSLIEFVDHRFLIEPYNDLSENQAIPKCSQIGWSVLGIIKSFWLAKYKRANVIYTLPSKSVVKDFVTPKVDPLVANNPVFSSWVGKTDSIALKNIGDRFIYFRGSWEQSAAISISAHVLINDELDRSNQKVVRTYRTRLDDAKRERPDLGWVWQYSNPSIPGYGVDEMWQKSDQKHWFVKCSHCGHEWFLDWPVSINFETKQYICVHCKGVLSDDDRRRGRWVAKYKNREISGYWINQMMCSWIPASKIIADSEGDQQVFFNFTLGKAYLSKDFSVSRDVITGCLNPDINSRTNVAIGVDNGVTKTVVIGNTYGIFKIYETDSWEDIEADIVKYNATCVIDSLPYPAMPIKLSEKYRGRVFIHYFDDNRKSGLVIEWGENDKTNVVRSDRTKIIDMLVQELINKEILFNLTLTQLEQYVYDWTQLFREVETNTQGIAKPVWRTIEGRRDHYAFATIYWRIALERSSVGGAVLRTPQKRSKMIQGVFVNPDHTVPAIDPQEILDRSLRKGKSWKTK